MAQILLPTGYAYGFTALLMSYKQLSQTLLEGYDCLVGSEAWGGEPVC